MNQKILKAYKLISERISFYSDNESHGIYMLYFILILHYFTKKINTGKAFLKFNLMNNETVQHKSKLSNSVTGCVTFT